MPESGESVSVTEGAPTVSADRIDAAGTEIAATPSSNPSESAKTVADATPGKADRGADTGADNNRANIDAHETADANKVPAQDDAAKETVASADSKPDGATEETASAEDAGAKKKTFLSAFFSSSPPKPNAAALAMKEAVPPVRREETKPLVRLASAEPGGINPIDSSITGPDALPGVRPGDQLFEISRKSGMSDDTSDIDVYEDSGSYDVASAGGMARLAPNGLLKQRDDVDVACLKPDLVRVLKTIERHYGKKVLVTSGYRSPSHNRRVRGAKRSLHMQCAAADIKIAGVSKWELARYVRAMPRRGGVGTYCHTNAIHVDVGPERDWNWRCRRAK